ncbi:probable cyclin-dependent serine/threonine-protein kinase DDB_G0292550, partial [Hyalella azteca]|uniref:Probable cyclin-dependent serine/threonine-protein kinase DDB_G0292550 n=1 Tax=Hyalella azteca TaxID=294128 RepID=A0A8B7PCZ5_HYAAZ
MDGKSDTSECLDNYTKHGHKNENNSKHSHNKHNNMKYNNNSDNNNDAHTIDLNQHTNDHNNNDNNGECCSQRQCRSRGGLFRATRGISESETAAEYPRNLGFNSGKTVPMEDGSQSSDFQEHVRMENKFRCSDSEENMQTRKKIHAQASLYHQQPYDASGEALGRFLDTANQNFDTSAGHSHLTPSSHIGMGDFLPHCSPSADPHCPHSADPHCPISADPHCPLSMDPHCPLSAGPHCPL